MSWDKLLELAIFLPAIQYLLGEATIFERIRGKLPPTWQELLRCPACCGFWLGCAAGGAGFGPWAQSGGRVEVVGGAVLTGLAAIAVVPTVRGLMALGWAASQPPHDHHDHDKEEPGP